MFSASEQQQSLSVEDYFTSTLNDTSFEDFPLPAADESETASLHQPLSNARPSVEDLVRIASSKFIQSRSVAALPQFPELTALSEEEWQSVELARLLLEAAEEIGARRFARAKPLLERCDWASSPTGTPVQRLVFYYSRALRDRIDRETGRIASRDVAREQSFDLYKVMMTPSIAAAEFHRKVPFAQVAQFAGIQCIFEHVERSRNIHIIDLGIRCGQQWTILMHALSSKKRCRIKRLKITAVTTLAKGPIEEIGERLVGFAQTMNLHCCFEVIAVRDFAELNRAHFTLVPGEAVAVFAEHVVSTLTEPSNRLDSLVRAVRSLNPRVMVVTEVEGNQNSVAFVSRFVETLFFASAYFDCLEKCLGGQDEPLRGFAESTLMGEGSKIVLAIEGPERIIRNMKVDVWRTYFQRFGMAEAKLSSSSLYQAELVAKRLPSWSPCTVGMDGKSLIVGWKGMPIKSVTAWKF
ncbi:unnamed protein product [Linum tenue]|uniref:Uncharacterized protein n=5 Tax=Linum tenue TaxID=586396 RepID=A0AAV0P780_9ROSI|nr:unnamed protein product [Linum tenue]